MGIPAEQAVNYKSEKVIAAQPEEEAQWKLAVGIDSTGILMNQHQLINNAGTKAHALQQRVKKKFKGEEHLEHLYRDRALGDLNQNSLFQHQDSI